MLNSGRFYVLYLVVQRGKIALKSILRDDHRSAAVVRVKRERSGVFEAAVQEEYHMAFGIVNEPERADATGLQAQIAHHPFRRGEREFARGFVTLRNQHIFEPMLDVVYGQIVVAREANKVVLVALVIAHEDVLAMHASVVVPIAFRLLDGLALGMVVGRKWDVVIVQVAQDAFLAVGYNIVVRHGYL